MTEPMPTGLVRVDPADVGLTRRRRGRGWSYLDATGAPITDAEVVARIKALVIPPAWQDVWICADPRGHIQATGIDARGRKQYRYHPRFRQQRDGVKFERLFDFGKVIWKIRDRVESDIHLPFLPREQVLAHIADIPQLRKAFAEGLDIHAMTASEMFGVPIRDMPSDVRRRGAVRAE